MLNTKQRIFVGAYLVCVLNLAALILYSSELLSIETVMDMFVSIAAVFAGALIFDLHKYSKEQQMKDQTGVQNEKEINLES